MFQKAGGTHSALVAGCFAEHNRHQAVAVARGAGDDVEAGIAGETRFQPVSTGKGFQKRIVGAEAAVADPHIGHRPVGRVLRKIIDDGARQLGEIAGGGHLTGIRQAIGVDVVGARHA